MILPQLISSIQSIASHFPTYVANFTNWFQDIRTLNPVLDEYLTQNIILTDSKEITEWFNKNIAPNIKNLGNLATTLYNGVFSVMRFLFEFMIGIIISIYLMSSKELFSGQSKKIAYALFEENKANHLIRNMRFVHKTFIGF